MGNHLCQWIRSDKFQLYDYGSDPKTGNAARYGTDAPPDDRAAWLLQGLACTAVRRALNVHPLVRVSNTHRFILVK